MNNKVSGGPDWRGSVGWESFCGAKGRWFNSQSGHVSGLQARSPVGGRQQATNRCFSRTSVSLLFLHPLPSLKINKIFKNQWHVKWFC